MAKNDDNNPAPKAPDTTAPASTAAPVQVEVPAPAPVAPGRLAPPPGVAPTPTNRMVRPGQPHVRLNPGEARVHVIREEPVWDAGFHRPKGTEYTTTAVRAKTLAFEGAVEVLEEAAPEGSEVAAV